MLSRELLDSITADTNDSTNLLLMVKADSCMKLSACALAAGSVAFQIKPAAVAAINAGDV